MSGRADLPVEAPVIGRLQPMWDQGQLGILELFVASQSFHPRGAVGFGCYSFVEPLIGNIL